MRFLRTVAAVCCILPFPALADTPPKLAGAWNCQSSLGPAVLEFRDARTLAYAGAPMAYRITGNRIQVMQDGQPVDYLFATQGDRLDIQTPEGELIRCARAAAGQSAGAPQGGGARGTLNHLLQGRLCSWSGSSSSGSSYSSTLKVFFDGRGRFTTGSESSFNVTSRDGGGNEIGSASGYGTGDAAGGTYEITAAQVGAPIRVKWNTGEDDVAYVHFVTGGRITEVKYGNKVFGAPLCE